MAKTAQELKALIQLNPAALSEAAVHLAEKKKEAEVFSLGLRFMKYERNELALCFFNKVLEINENNAQAYVNIGNIYYEKGDIDTAANFWRYALNVDATAEKAYLNLGNYYYRKGDVDQAISYWLILQSISPTENNSLFNLGVAYQDRNELMLSNFYFEKYLDKAITQKGTPPYEKAHKRIWALKVNAKHNFKIGLRCQNKKDYPRALKCYLKVIQSYPNHIKANLNAGHICYMKDKITDAIKFWHRVLILDPTNYNNILNLAVAYDRSEQNSYAYCLYQRYLNTLEDLETFEAIKIQSRLKEIEKGFDSKDTLYNFHYSKAEEYFRKKDYLNAFSEYENCLTLKPENEELEIKISTIRAALRPEANLAKAFIRTGKKALNNLEIASAVEHFRAAYNLNPGEESLLEIKENLAKCARIIKKAQQVNA